jgi:hypothetical protein
MPTPRETILQALLAALQTVPGATVLRGAILPERIPAGGLLILGDGDETSCISSLRTMKKRKG